MAIMAKSMGEVTYKDISSLHKWALVILISMGSSIIYAPMYLKNVFYDPLMQALGCTNADLGMMVSAYGLAAMICYLPSGIIADKFRMRTLATAGNGRNLHPRMVGHPLQGCSSVLRRRRVCIQDRH